MKLITQSEMACFQRCPREHYYRYSLMKDSEDKSEATDIGNLFHIGAASFWKNGDAINAKSMVAESPGYDMEHVSYAIDMLDVYMERYKDLQQQWKTLYVEKEIHHDFGNGVCFYGVMDAVVDTESGLYLMEHKTTSSDISWHSNYWDQMRVSQQLCLYLFALRESGEKVQGVWVDAIKRGTKEQMVASPTKHMAMRCMAIESFDIDSAVSDMQDIAEMMSYGVHPKNTKSCRRGFNSSCGFFDVCNKTKSIDSYKERERKISWAK